MQAARSSTSMTKLPEDSFDNFEYFLKVIKMEKYGEIFEQQNIKTLEQLRSSDSFTQKLKNRSSMRWAFPFPIKSRSSKSYAIWVFDPSL
jgi:hypothetical protein